MRIACLCPTYKRPVYLQNAIACFLAQTHPDKALFIVDDSGQIKAQAGENWKLISITSRQPTLSMKFNLLSGVAGEFEPDAYAVWEDDDIFLPDCLSAINSALEEGGEYVAPRRVYSTYDQELGHVQQEDAIGRFHSSWAFTRKLFNRVNGYPMPDQLRLTFDQEMRQRLLDATGESLPTACDSGHYVYRWGNESIAGLQIGYHGSSSGDAGFQDHWDALGRQQVSPVGDLFPGFDKETVILYQKLAQTIVKANTNTLRPSGVST